MSPSIREYIVKNHQFWHYDDNDRLLIGEGARPVAMSSPITDYFKNRYDAEVDASNVEVAFEAEVIAIYEMLIPCFPESSRNLFSEYVAIGMTSFDRPVACVKPCLDGFAILFDFRMDHLLVHPTVLCSARVLNLIDAASAQLLFNISIAASSYNNFLYHEPVFTLTINREWINHVVWGMTVFIVAHEMAHVYLRHFDEEAFCSWELYDKFGNQIDLSGYSPRQQIEFQADVFATEVLLKAIDNNLMPGFSSIGIEPRNSLLQAIVWFFTILECGDIINERLTAEDPGMYGVDDNYPPSLLRAQLAIGHILKEAGDAITSLDMAIDVFKTFEQVARNCPIMESDDPKFLMQLLPDFYNMDLYAKWLEAR
jgi:hypothetical protein